MTCHCGTEFEPSKPHQKHCSRRCNSRAAGRRREAAARAQPKQRYRRRCARLACSKKFATVNVQRLFCKPHCAQVASQKARRACRAAERKYAEEARA